MDTTPIPKISSTNPEPTPPQAQPSQLSNTSINEPPKRRIPWAVIIIVAIVVILGLIGWMSFGTISIEPTPEADKIYINNQEINSSSVKRLPGTIDVKIEKEGYITYEKEFKLGFNGSLSLTPKLIPLPTATALDTTALSPLATDSEGIGVKAISTDKKYLIYSRIDTTGDKETPTTTNLNLEALDGIKSVQYPLDQSFALVIRNDEVGILDFARRDVASQNYTAFGENIRSIALTQDGTEVFYWQHDPDNNTNYMIRDTIKQDKTDRYFDQPLIDQLNLTNPLLRWSNDNKYVLAIESNIIVIDIINREAKVISNEEGFEDAYLTQDNKKIIALTEKGQVVVVDLTAEATTEAADENSSDTESASQGTENSETTDNATASPYKIDTLDIFTSPERFVYQDNTAYIVTDSGDFISYNFDTNSEIRYLIDSSISADKIETLAVDPETAKVYLLVDGKLYEQELVRADYE